MLTKTRVYMPLLVDQGYLAKRKSANRALFPYELLIFQHATQTILDLQTRAASSVEMSVHVVLESSFVGVDQLRTYGTGRHGSVLC